MDLIIRLILVEFIFLAIILCIWLLKETIELFGKKVILYILLSIPCALVVQYFCFK